VGRVVDDAAAELGGRGRAGSRRGGFTWAAFGALGGFGFLNAILGPALPYLRASEHISYVVGAAHQVAFALGGGLAGLLAARVSARPSRAVIIRFGLVAAAVAGLGVGYGDRVAVTVVAALVVSLLGSSAMIRLWAALSDAHTGHRTVAMTEGEVAVSLGGITAPVLVGGLAATALSWRFAFVIGAVLVIVTVAISAAVRIPAWRPTPSAPAVRAGTAAGSGWLKPTLVVVFAVVALEFSLSFWLASYLNDSVGLSRNLAVIMVAGLYAANLLGRLVASRLGHYTTTTRLLTASIGVGLAGPADPAGRHQRRRRGHRPGPGRRRDRRHLPADIRAAHRRQPAPRRYRGMSFPSNRGGFFIMVGSAGGGQAFDSWRWFRSR